MLTLSYLKVLYPVLPLEIPPKYIYTMEYYSVIRKNEIMPFAATWMQLEIILLSEVSQKEKDKYDITYMWNLKKKWYKWTDLETEIDSQT